MRSFLYHKSVPQGRIFTDEREYEKAIGDGWVQAPWLINEVKENALIVEDSPKPPIEETKPVVRRTFGRKTAK